MSWDFSTHSIDLYTGLLKVQLFLLNFWMLCRSAALLKLQISRAEGFPISLTPSLLLLLKFCWTWDFCPPFWIKQSPPAVKLLVFTASHILLDLSLSSRVRGGSLKQEHLKLPLFLPEVQEFLYEWIFLNVSFVFDQFSEPALKLLFMTILCSLTLFLGERICQCLHSAMGLP